MVRRIYTRQGVAVAITRQPRLVTSPPSSVRPLGQQFEPRQEDWPDAGWSAEKTGSINGGGAALPRTAIVTVPRRPPIPADGAVHAKWPLGWRPPLLC